LGLSSSPLSIPIQVSASLETPLLLDNSQLTKGGTARLGNAYGVCVIFVTFITTCMVSLVAIIIWKINLFIVIFLFLTFAAFDGVYLSSALTKIPTGAWFTIVLATILSSIFVLWVSSISYAELHDSNSYLAIWEGATVGRRRRGPL
jgi:K+ transporter